MSRAQEPKQANMQVQATGQAQAHEQFQAQAHAQSQASVHAPSQSQGVSFHPLRSLLHGCIELLYFVPVPLAAALYLLGSSMAALCWVLTLPVVYAVSGMAGSQMKTSRRITRWLGSLVFGCLPIVLVMLVQGEFRPAAMVLAIGGAAAAYRGFLDGFGGNEQYPFSSGPMLAGMIIHIAAQAIRQLLDRLDPYAGWLTVCGVASVVLYLFLLNGQLVRNEHDGNGRSGLAFQLFRRQNRLLTGLIVLLAAAIGLFTVWESWLADGFKRLAAVIAKWLSRPGEEPEPDTPPLDNTPPQLPADAPSQPEHWMQVLEEIVRIAVIVIVGIALLGALYYLSRYVLRLIRKGMDRLMERSRHQAEDEQGYEDEVENLMSLTKWTDQWKQRLSSLTVSGNEARAWAGLSGEERIRLLYKLRLRNSIKKGYDYKPQLTPKETAADLASWHKQSISGEERLFQLYDQVKYGERKPDLTETEALKPLMNKER